MTRTTAITALGITDQHHHPFSNLIWAHTCASAPSAWLQERLQDPTRLTWHTQRFGKAKYLTYDPLLEDLVFTFLHKYARFLWPGSRKHRAHLLAEFQYNWIKHTKVPPPFRRDVKAWEGRDVTLTEAAVKSPIGKALLLYVKALLEGSKGRDLVSGKMADEYLESIVGPEQYMEFLAIQLRRQQADDDVEMSGTSESGEDEDTEMLAMHEIGDKRGIDAAPAVQLPNKRPRFDSNAGASVHDPHGSATEQAASVSTVARATEEDLKRSIVYGGGDEDDDFF